MTLCLCLCTAPIPVLKIPRTALYHPLSLFLAPDFLLLFIFQAYIPLIQLCLSSAFALPSSDPFPLSSTSNLPCIIAYEISCLILFCLLHTCFFFLCSLETSRIALNVFLYIPSEKGFHMPPFTASRNNHGPPIFLFFASSSNFRHLLSIYLKDPSPLFELP